MDHFTALLLTEPRVLGSGGPVLLDTCKVL